MSHCQFKATALNKCSYLRLIATTKLTLYMCCQDTTLCASQPCSLGIVMKLEQLQSISAAASKESSMLVALENMEKEWEGLEFKVTAYKDTGRHAETCVRVPHGMLEEHECRLLGIIHNTNMGAFKLDSSSKL